MAENVSYNSSSSGFLSSLFSEYLTEIDRVVAEEAYCFDTERFSEALVNAVICEALKDIALRTPRRPMNKHEIVASIIEELLPTIEEVELQEEELVEYPGEGFWYYPSSMNSTLEDLSFTGWPMISEFSIKLGMETIEKYVRTWERYQNWYYHVEFLGFESEDCSNYFVYEVEWSMPTNEYPIPQAVANVYFSLEVSKMVPYDREINVTYLFETSNLIHVPGKIDFQEKWLNDIIEAKLRFYRNLTF